MANDKVVIHHSAGEPNRSVNSFIFLQFYPIFGENLCILFD